MTADSYTWQKAEVLDALSLNFEDSVIIVDAQLNLQFFNRVAHQRHIKFFHKDLGMLTNILQLFEGEQKITMQQLFMDVLNGERKFLERHEIASNKEYFFENVFAPLLDEDGAVKGVQVVSKDVSLNRRLLATINSQTEKLEENLASYNKIMELSMDMICTFDDDGRFITVSDACYAILGYTKEELKGRHYADFIMPDDHEKSKDASFGIKSGKGIKYFANRFRHKNGETVALIWSAQWDKSSSLMYCIGREATARLELEKMMEGNERKLQAMIKAGNDLISILDAEGKYTYVSPSAKTVLGYEPNDLLGHSFLDFVHPDDVALLVEKFQQAVSSPEIFVEEFKFRNKDGMWTWIQTVAINLLDDPAVKGIVCNSRDITFNKKTEEERTALIEALYKNVDDLRQFTYIISHNLRSPLSNMMALLSFMNEDADSENGLIVSKLKEATHKLNDTLHDLMNILVIKENINLERNYINLSDSIHAVTNSIDLLIKEHKCRIVIDCPNDAEVFFNRNYLESILLNLFTNAIKYRSPERIPSITISCDQEELYDILKFRDNGIGIDLTKHKDRVFGMYQRFHQHSDSRGLGLYIVRSQLTALGGKIEVESKPGEGTCFNMFFRKK